ncbi:NlpC/P60 family protein [Amycolatopsis sp. 195334CR]|uniref:C40 family peptidase n=1 Tax=Amycolatopsis sp. 195334CR TaxID=2814588 RepID=UPI0027DE1E95|nr:NlpC/P60 family protein [Amycolatopsis sp. 195334CR]
MSPHRSRLATCGAFLTTTAVILGFGVTPAAAQPEETSDAMRRYQELGAEAAKTDEDLKQAEEDLKARRAERDQANTDLAAATDALGRTQGLEEEFRGEVDDLASASFRGAGVTRMSALLTSDSSQQFLDQMSALEVLAADKAEALGRFRGATAEAGRARSASAEAQQRAQEATGTAERTAEQVRDRKRTLDGQIKEVRRALDRLPSAEKAALGKVQDNGSYLGPPGAANDALQAALSKRGSEYQWGATGPAEFDCSGLTSWAYRQAGISIPRTSRQQYTAGKPVSLNALQPGDLLFYDDGTGNPGAIHHVGMFVGNGKMVDAPTEGQLVDVRSMKGDGHLMGARRIVG